MVKMEAGAATFVRSSFGMSRPSNSIGRSGACVLPDFVRFGTKLPPSIKVGDICFGF